MSARQQGVEVHGFGAARADFLGGQQRIAGDDRQAEALRDARHPAADFADADKADGAALDLASHQRFAAAGRAGAQGRARFVQALDQ